MRIILLLCAALALTATAVPVEEVPAAEEIHQVDGELPVETEVEEIKFLAEVERSSCPIDWFKFGSRCFNFISNETTWVDAERYCMRYGTHLASIHNYGEYEFVRELARSNTDRFPQAWLGGNDAVQNTVWIWSDGSKFDYENWSDYEPKDDLSRGGCIVMNRSGDSPWGDVSCDLRLPFTCGTSPP